MKNNFFSLLGISLTIILSACQTMQMADNKNAQIKANLNVQLGIGYLQQGDVQKAKTKLLLALKEKSDWPPALDAMAYFMERTGEIEQAKIYYQRSLAVAPNDGKVLNNYGTFLCRQKQYAEAERYFLAAVKDPDYITTGEAYENAGLCALDIPDNQKAEMYFKKALLQEPQKTALKFELAKLAYKRAEYQVAKQYIDSYLSLAQASPPVLLLAYQVSKQLNDSFAASRYAALLRNNYPGTPEARLIDN